MAAVAIEQKCRALHFLQGTGWAVANQAEIARYRIHYADGQEAVVPVVYGRDVRDWWFSVHMPEAEKEGGVVAWRGTQEKWKQDPGQGVRLYLQTWTNRRPDVEVKSLDFSATGGSAPFLIAITAE